MRLSVVASLYKSARYIEEFCDRASAAARDVAGENFEIVLVNDGSPDESLEIAKARVARDPHVCVVDLSRNFGHHKAMMTGLGYAQGELVFLIDVDFEEEPELLREFHEKLRETGADVVFGVQKRRKGGWAERASGDAFYWLFNRLSSVQIPKDVCTVRLMTRRYVDALLRHEEREVVIAGLWQITGFDQVPVGIVKHSKGETSYTVGRKMAALVNSVTSFSNRPLIAIFYIGTLISTLAFLYLVFLVWNWAFHNKPPSGWTSLMGSIWLIGGLLMSAIGVVGIYMAKIFSETKRRPLSIVREVYGRNQT